MLEITDLPPQIVPALNALAQRLSRHIRGHRDASLEVHVRGVLEAWRAEAASMLGGVVTAATTGADPAPRPPRSACPCCGRGRAAERWRRRTLETRLGSLRFMRTRHRCNTCRQRWSGADRTLGLRPRQRTSAGLARWEAEVAARTTFREAAELLAELAGVQVGSETLRTHAEQLGTECEGQHRRAMAQVQATHEPPSALPRTPAPGLLVVEAMA